MKRLTSKNPLTENEAMNLSLTDLYMRLKVYEDAEAEGRLLILPCKVGDTVYAIKNREIYATAVIGFRVHEWTGLCVLLLFDERKTNGSYELRIDDFGKTVFLNREEAEAALMGGVESRR